MKDMSDTGERGPIDEDEALFREKKVPHVTGVESLERPLVQAIRTKDKTLLKKILENTNQQVITNTIEKIPVDVVFPFLAFAIRQLQASPEQVMKTIPWVHAILSIHTSYLLSVPDIASSLAPLQMTISYRLNTFHEVTRIQGKLQFLLHSEPLNSGWDVDTNNPLKRMVDKL